jgi:hypothetical protein
MSLARHTIKALLVTFSLAPAALIACGGTNGQDPASAGATSTDSALVVTPSAGGASLTVSADGSACADPRAIVTAHQADLQKLCGKGELPMPADVSDTSCGDGQVASITFKCVEAKAPPPPASGCRGFQIRDDDSAIARGQKALPALPPLVCPLLGGAPPPPPSGTAMPGGGPSGTSTGFYPPPPPSGSGTGFYPPPIGTGTGGVPIPDPSGTYMPPPPPSGTGTAWPDPSGTGTAYPSPSGAGNGTSGGCVMPPVIECCAPPPPPAPSGTWTGGGPAPSNTADDTAPK